MITSIGGVLRLVLHHAPEPEPVVEAAAPEPDGPEVELSAYAEDCRLFGRVRLDAARLTDLLNTHEALVLVDVLVERLLDGSVVEIPELSVTRDELLVVEATGPRGDPARRTRAHRHPLAVKLGPYELRGYVHLAPGADILGAIRRRRPMIPLTDASISYAVRDAPSVRRAGTLIFNRECADWLRVIDDASIEFPELPLPAPPPPAAPKPLLAGLAPSSIARSR